MNLRTPLTTAAVLISRLEVQAAAAKTPFLHHPAPPLATAVVLILRLEVQAAAAETSFLRHRTTLPVVPRYRTLWTTTMKSRPVPEPPIPSSGSRGVGRFPPHIIRICSATVNSILSNLAFMTSFSALNRRVELSSFTFGSVTRCLTNVECPICLTEFEAHEWLRRLSWCLHAFHAACIDRWLDGNETCPVCRYPLFPTEAQLEMNLRTAAYDRGKSHFEIGSPSRRREDSLSASSHSAASDFGSSHFEIGSPSRRRGDFLSVSSYYSASASLLQDIVDDHNEVPAQ
ncbi:unnamed protein product [Cuscuta campestris]|uniref:RING-type domain-containing protein n=1 Tax=Cuscuta campestris TaxID=132261 RepID=A0A484LH19_9ASTE|nr:unnamed protein product [Cuscuta campestris]